MLHATYYEFVNFRFASTIFLATSLTGGDTEKASCSEDTNCDCTELKRLRRSFIQQSAAATAQATINPLKQEIVHYLALRDDSTSLEFWKRNESAFPLFCSMAAVYLVVSLGRVPVESLFITAALLLNAKQSSLAPYRANVVCFVYDNYLLT